VDCVRHRESSRLKYHQILWRSICSTSRILSLKEVSYCLYEDGEVRRPYSGMILSTKLRRVSNGSLFQQRATQPQMVLFSLYGKGITESTRSRY
jgi:hypothetical protein